METASRKLSIPLPSVERSCDPSLAAVRSHFYATRTHWCAEGTGETERAGGTEGADG